MMEPTDIMALYKSAPLEAIGMIILGGIGYLWKNKSEKKDQAESRGLDNREIERLNSLIKDRDRVVDIISKERDEERDRADGAFAKQLELTERFSEMRAQLAEALTNLKQVNEKMENLFNENNELRAEMASMTDELKTLRMAINKGAQ